MQSLHLVTQQTQLIQDDFGATLVHYAARNGNTKILKFLVTNCKMDPNLRTKNGSLPAHEAASFGQLSALIWLINNTETSLWDRDDCGQTFLHLASR